MSLRKNSSTCPCHVGASMGQRVDAVMVGRSVSVESSRRSIDDTAMVDRSSQWKGLTDLLIIFEIITSLLEGVPAVDEWTIFNGFRMASTTASTSGLVHDDLIRIPRCAQISLCEKPL